MAEHVVRGADVVQRVGNAGMKAVDSVLSIEALLDGERFVVGD